MFRNFLRVIIVCLVVVLVLIAAALADDRSPNRAIQEEVWAIPVTLPTIAYVVRPVGDGPFPLVVMNHGVSLNQRERGYFPLVEFRDAAMWFARRGYMVVAPTGSGYGAGRAISTLRFSLVHSPSSPALLPSRACCVIR